MNDLNKSLTLSKDGKRPEMLFISRRNPESVENNFKFELQWAENNYTITIKSDSRVEVISELKKFRASFQSYSQLVNRFR